MKAQVPDKAQVLQQGRHKDRQLRDMRMGNTHTTERSKPRSNIDLHANRDDNSHNLRASVHLRAKNGDTHSLHTRDRRRANGRVPEHFRLNW